jgi:hypothetical protein
MQPGPTLIHIKVRARTTGFEARCKALWAARIGAAEPSKRSHDQYGKPIGIVTVERHRRISDMRGHCRPTQSEGADERGGVQHAAGEAPLVVIPTDDVSEAGIQDGGLCRVEDTGSGVVIEVYTNKRLVVVVKNAV